jgi:hypothetical protein
VRPRKPKLSREALTDLELLGVEAVRDMVRLSTDTPIPTTFALENSRLKRPDAIAWLRWKERKAARRENWRFWLTFAVVVIGALAAVVAAIEGLPTLKALFNPA